MKTMKHATAVIALLLATNMNGFSQQTDTVTIDAAKVNTNVLKPGTHRYLVYFKNGKDSSRKNYQVWSRTIDLITYKNKPAISITQEWENNDTVTHKVYSVSDRKTFAPLFHESWWRGRGSSQFDFTTKEGYFQNALLTSADTARVKKMMYEAFVKAQDQYVLNWHLDLETFPLLPYKEGVTFKINFYDPGFSAPAFQVYTVTGSAQLTGYNDQKIDCWLLKHTSGANTEIFWISKATKEVLKLEQEYAPGRFRYKIKMGYSV
jgi:hypothetical protein